MDPTYELISKQVLTSNESSVTFSNIPQTYKDLYLVVSARGTRAATLDEMEMAFNNSTSNQSSRRLYGDGSSVGSNTSSTLYIGTFPGSTSTSNTFNNSEIYIVNYSASVNKSYSATTVEERNATNPVYTYLSSGLWSNTSAISSISLKAQNALFTASSSFYLYGIKNADDGGRGYFGPAMTGGDEVFTTGNGYKVHVFKNSGTLNVTAPGEVEYLVIGGGGGAGSDRGGGGGAGGYRCSVSGESSGGGNSNEKPLLVNTGQYSVIVGSGGAGNNFNTAGASGSDSSLISVVSFGGGGGGSGAQPGGKNGGSGGGAGTSGVGGSSQGAQGFGGGNANGVRAGGGGGASQSGVSGSTNGGNGGNGIYSSITGSSIPRAGGGGGANSTSGTAGAGGIGGGGNGVAGDTGSGGSSATINTSSGGGGGTGGPLNNGGNGGSGIVIIRYRV